MEKSTKKLYTMQPEDSDAKVRDLYRQAEDPCAIPPTDEYGFVLKGITTVSENYPGIRMQWYMIIDRYADDIKKFKMAIIRNHLLEKGIPLSLKSRIWEDLIQCNCKVDYAALRDSATQHDYQIHVDVQRTFRQHFLFLKAYGRGQTELFSVLSALANYNKRVGYCQGMSDICAILLMHFREEEAFRIYISLAEKNDLWNLFDPGLSKVPTIIKYQSVVLARCIPHIQQHLTVCDIDLGLHSISWYMTLFSRFEIKLVLRIWDFIFFYGFNVLLYFFAAILAYFENDILSKTNDQLLELFSRLCEMRVDEDVIVSLAVEFMNRLNFKYINKNGQ